MPHPIPIPHKADDLILEAILILYLRQHQKRFDLIFEAIMILYLRP